MARELQHYWRPVTGRLWSDQRFLSMSDRGRMLWLYFLTAPSLPIPGVIISGPARVAEDLTWSGDGVMDGFREIQRSGLQARWEGRVIWLVNALRHQPVNGPNAIHGWRPFWKDIPNVPLKVDLWQSLKIACQRWPKVFGEALPKPVGDPVGHPVLEDGHPGDSGNTNTNTITNTNTYERESAPPAAPLSLSLSSGSTAQLESKLIAYGGDVARKRIERAKTSKGKPAPTEAEKLVANRVLAKLTEHSGVSYHRSPKHLERVVDRLRDGVTEAELRAVIGYCAVEKGWKGNAKMHQFLRPKTLFGPENIAEYLDEACSAYAEAIAAFKPDDAQPTLTLVPEAG